jgi:hypothetical protein
MSKLLSDINVYVLYHLLTSPEVGCSPQLKHVGA